MRRYPRILFLLLFFLFFVACATTPRTDRVNPQYLERLSSTRSITVVPLRTDVYQITAGGIAEKMDEWSALARRKVMTAVYGELNAKPMILVNLGDIILFLYVK